ncbi:MAG: sortase [Bacillota bacterium]|nr:sortase [Bacillota bacterium]
MKKYISTLLLIAGIGLLAAGVFSISKSNREQQIDLQEVFEYNNEKGIPNKEGTDQESMKSTEASEPELTRSQFQNGMMAVIIPKIGVKAAVMDGTELSTLKKGPGLYKESDLPDKDKGNVCIAAHSDTYFKNIYKLQKGDEIDIIFTGSRYIYKVVDVRTIEKNDWSPIKTTETPCITLTTCHPETGNKQRIAVRGEFSSIEREAVAQIKS